jgi:hypothetical protein
MMRIRNEIFKPGSVWVNIVTNSRYSNELSRYGIDYRYTFDKFITNSSIRYLTTNVKEGVYIPTYDTISLSEFLHYFVQDLSSPLEGTLHKTKFLVKILVGEGEVDTLKNLLVELDI